METNTTSICVTSYNSGGMGLDKQNFMKTLTLFFDVLSLKEHFLLDAGNKKYNNTHKLKNYFGDSYDMFIKPAFKNDFKISKGRESGGLVIMWRKTLTKYVTNIKNDLYQVQAVKFNFPPADFLYS